MVLGGLDEERNPFVGRKLRQSEDCFLFDLDFRISLDGLGDR